MRRVFAAAVIGALLTLAGPRSAADGPLTYNQLHISMHFKRFPVPGDQDRAHTVDCPRGTTLVSGGAFLFDPGVDINGDTAIPRNAELTSSYPTARGWHAGASANNNMVPSLQMQITVMCAHRSIPFTTIRENSSVGENGFHAPVDHFCPGRSQVLTGGGFWHVPGGTKPHDTVDEHLTGGSSIRSGIGWYASGWSNEPVTLTFTLVMHCTTAIARYQSPPVAATADLHPGDAAAFYSPACAADTHAIAGGIVFSYPGTVGVADDPSTSFASSAPTTDGKGWFVAGENTSSATYGLTSLAMCLPDA